MVELNNYTDAYNFYKEYKDRDSLKLSSQNRYRFLVSVRNLLKKMEREDEIGEIDLLIEKLKPHYYLKAEEEEKRINNSIIRQSLAPLSRYDENKNVVFHFFKL